MPTPTIVSDALTTLARLKTFLGISSDRYDGLFTQLINQATGFIKQYTKRDIKRATYTDEIYDGPGTEIIILKQFPVTAFSSLQYRNDNDPDTASWTTFDTSDYFWYADGRIKHASAKFLNVPQKYRATYTAGYLIDFNNENDTTKHTLPFELEYVCHKLVSAMFNSRKGEGISRSQIGDSSFILRDAIMNSPEIRAILDKYTAPTI